MRDVFTICLLRARPSDFRDFHFYCANKICLLTANVIVSAVDTRIIDPAVDIR